VAYFPNDIYDRDMRWASDSEYDYHFWQIEKICLEWQNRPWKWLYKDTFVVIKWKEYLLRSNKIFSPEEIIKIHKYDLYKTLTSEAWKFELSMPLILKDNIENWLAKAHNIWVENLEDFFKLVKIELRLKYNKPRKI
jgi:hypothetical protein